MRAASIGNLHREVTAVIFSLLLAHTAAATCPPPEEQSLSDVHCPRSAHTSQEALDLCYMKASR